MLSKGLSKDHLFGHMLKCAFEIGFFLKEEEEDENHRVHSPMHLLSIMHHASCNAILVVLSNNEEEKKQMAFFSCQYRCGRIRVFSEKKWRNASTIWRDVRSTLLEMTDWEKDLRLNEEKLVRNRREEVDPREPIERNRYLPNDYHDLYPFFSKWFPPILWCFRPDLHHLLAKEQGLLSFSLQIHFFEFILWEHYSSATERFLHVKYVFHPWVSNNWKQLKTNNSPVDWRRTITYRLFFHPEYLVNRYSFRSPIRACLLAHHYRDRMLWKLFSTRYFRV